ncbi:MAG: Nif3-like dinuclear metal center hexameric protein [Bacteroidetes bacterium]|nr:Nif3-like dinuclear metal center hexameric protein [Bacteroidota bacterium]
MNIRNIVEPLEELAPLSTQESYDNSGLIIGSYNDKIESAIICIDITEEIVEEAISKKCQLIISHHPLIFSGLKKINGNNLVERCVIKAIKNNIAIYACHTNLDNSIDGVNSYICEKLGLKKLRILEPQKGMLKKIVTFCPTNKANKVRNAIFAAGVGSIGNYDSCSFNSEGQGTFKALENAKPYVGEINELHFENEIKIECVFPKNLERQIIAALISAHPYEEVAYDILTLDNEFPKIGAGIIAELEKPMKEKDFLLKVKKIFNLKIIKHTPFLNKQIKTIAICGGSGSFLINSAIKSNAQIFLTGDIKYHQFFEAEDRIVIADLGHYESEQFTKELLFSIIKKKFPKFALSISEINTNPVNYL